MQQPQGLSCEINGEQPEWDFWTIWKTSRHLPCKWRRQELYNFDDDYNNYVYDPWWLEVEQSIKHRKIEETGEFSDGAM
uniref:Uncharacterized protein n=1 Tax=Timema cristinae TaxID=61476 RepID=A0A7R9CRU0_TIMCR|nr:unnamed protein product [Timema cristinae]